jgi:hypothetical protein
MQLLSPAGRRRRSLASLILTGIACIGAVSAGAAEPPLEYQVKAVFLFNFAQFVEWPRAAFADPVEPLVIGVLGSDPFGQFLDQTVQDERVNGHPIVVQRFANLRELQRCHILYVASSEMPRLADILARAHPQHTLTVSDADQFAVRGGIISLMTVAGKIRFGVNIQSAEAAQLTISSQILRRAEIVGQDAQ